MPFPPILLNNLTMDMNIHQYKSNQKGNLKNLSSKNKIILYSPLPYFSVSRFFGNTNI